MKKYLIILVAVIIIILVVVTYFTCKKKPTPNSVGQNQGNIANGTISNVGLDEKAFFPGLGRDGKTIYFLGDQGSKIKKFTIENRKTETLFNNELLYIQQVFWSPDKNKVIIKNNDPNASSSTQLFNLDSNSEKDLSGNIQNVLWSPDSNIIYYHYFDEDNGQNQLNFSNSDGSDWQNIIDLEYTFYGLAWLNNFQDIGYWSVPSDLGGTIFNSVNISSKAIKDIIKDFKLGAAKASPDGSYFTYEKFDQKNNNYTIAYAKADGSQDKDTGYVSSLEKIGWLNNKTLILSERDKDTSSDTIFLIDVTTGGKTKIENNGDQLNINLDMKNIMPLDDKSFYFTSNDALYKLVW